MGHEGHGVLDGAAQHPAHIARECRLTVLGAVARQKAIVGVRPNGFDQQRIGLWLALQLGQLSSRKLEYHLVIQYPADQRFCNFVSRIDRFQLGQACGVHDLVGVEKGADATKAKVTPDHKGRLVTFVRQHIAQTSHLGHEFIDLFKVGPIKRPTGQDGHGAIGGNQTGKAPPCARNLTDTAEGHPPFGQRLQRCIGIAPYRRISKLAIRAFHINHQHVGLLTCLAQLWLGQLPRKIRRNCRAKL